MNDDVRRMYEVERLSLAEIGKRIGMSRHGVGKRLKKLGVAMRSPSERANRDLSPPCREARLAGSRIGNLRSKAAAEARIERAVAMRREDETLTAARAARIVGTDAGKVRKRFVQLGLAPPMPTRSQEAPAPAPVTKAEPPMTFLDHLRRAYPGGMPIEARVWRPGA